MTKMKSSQSSRVAAKKGRQSNYLFFILRKKGRLAFMSCLTHPIKRKTKINRMSISGSLIIHVPIVISF